ncbi:Anti-sigma F factor [bacterium HR11]|nr:Anti-sigma F factor [bacterium HR11]
MVELVIPSQLSFLTLAEEVARALISGYALSEEDRDFALLAVHEAVANAIVHGNRQDPRRVVSLRFILEPHGFYVEVQDQGNGFEPEAVPDPTKPENLLSPHGRGLLFIRTLMTEVEFARTPEGMRVRMYKAAPYRPERAEGT